jgi:hypothetical protein
VAQLSARPDRHAAYRERLVVPWWWWPIALAVAAFVATELAVGAVALRNPMTYVVTGVLALAGVWALSRITIAVDAEHLYVDDARLPRSVIGEVTVIDAAARRELLGPFRAARTSPPSARHASTRLRYA